MIVDKFKLRSEVYGDVAIFDFNNITSETPYILTGATGLSADSIVPLRYNQNRHGGDLYSMAMNSREIALKIALNPSYSSTGQKQDLRDDLYRAIYSNYIPNLWFDLYNGSTFIATINGVVTKLDAALFSSKQEIDLILKCSDPIFKATNKTTISNSGWNSTLGILTHNYSAGTAPVGFDAQININSPATHLFITYDTDAEFWIDFDFIAGDNVYLSSDPNKDIYIGRNASTGRAATRLVTQLSKYSTWPLLFPGVNNINIGSSARSGGVSFVTGTYYKSYWGV